MPRPLALCEASSVIGATSYVLTMVDGRIFWNGTLADVAPADRIALYEAMI